MLDVVFSEDQRGCSRKDNILRRIALNLFKKIHSKRASDERE
jgi:hypothetical protein